MVLLGFMPASSQVVGESGYGQRQGSDESDVRVLRHEAFAVLPSARSGGEHGYGYEAQLLDFVFDREISEENGYQRD